MISIVDFQDRKQSLLARATRKGTSINSTNSKGKTDHSCNRNLRSNAPTSAHLLFDPGLDVADPVSPLLRHPSFEQMAGAFSSSTPLFLWISEKSTQKNRDL
jgi:hypothetical protein